MTHEDAEAVLSNPTGHTPEEIAEAQAIVNAAATTVAGAPAPVADLAAPVPQRLTTVLQELAKKGTTAEQGVYEHLLVIIGEAKMKIQALAKGLTQEADHIVHEIHDHFSRL